MAEAKKRPQTTLILAALFILAVLLMMGPSYTLLVKPRGQAFDLYWIWVGGRAILAGENPYGPETTRLIQIGVFGNVIPPGKYQHGFPHPAHIAFVLLPFVTLPFSWSALLWISLQLPLFMVTLLLGLDLLRWRLRPALLFPLTVLATLGFRYPMNVYVLGQLHFFVLFCGVLALWLYRRGHPRWAALALACTTIRPDLSLPALALALFLVRNSPRRNEFLLALAGAGLALALLPAFFIGVWPLTWLRAIGAYGSNPFATWPPELLPWLWLKIALPAGGLLWLGRYVAAARKNPASVAQAMLISATVIAALVVLPQTGSYSLTLLLIPGLVAMRYAPRRPLKWLVAAGLLTPWLYFALGKIYPPLDRQIFLLLPLQFALFLEAARHLSSRRAKS